MWTPGPGMQCAEFNHSVSIWDALSVSDSHAFAVGDRLAFRVIISNA